MARLHFTDHARSDLHETCTEIAKDSPTHTRRFIKKLEKLCWLLASQPRIGRPRNELASGLRSLAVGRYIVFFRPVADGAEIVRIIQGAQDLRDYKDAAGNLGKDAP